MNLRVSKVSKSFGKNKVLDNISAVFNHGEITGIFGRNGSGKSTLLKMIFGTLQADSIELSINADFINPKKVISSQSIAYLPQNSCLPKNITVRKLIPLYYEDGEQQDQLFYNPPIASFEKLKVGQLSIGQLRYLEILMIVYLNHDYVMLDEPFSMIDPLYKDLIKDLLIKLKKKKGIIVTDHYYQDVLQITDTNYLIKAAKIYTVKNKHELSQLGYLSIDRC
jgi:ABC-type (unclassified) transport system, ATPase component